MAFAIMRCNKIKSMGAVSNSLKHCFRESKTLNADPERTPTNEHLAASSKDEAMGKLRDLLPEKRRKDAIVAVEYVLTASPEWFKNTNQEQHQDFFDSSMKWINDKYGPENLITASIHKDELTPHLSVFVVPMTKDGRLSAKEMIGNKAKMVEDQTGYAKAVEHLGLERGIEGSRATHQRVKSHYAAIEIAEERAPRISLEELKPRKLKGGTLVEKIIGVSETDEAVVDRVNKRISEITTPIIDKATKADYEKRRADTLAKALGESKKAVERGFGSPQGLTQEQLLKTRKVVEVMKRKNEQERIQERDRTRQIRRDLSKTKSRDLGR
jgi:hypothetical protein